MTEPFEYLNGLEPEPDAPLMDNPARLYCPQCREQDRTVCDEPGFCGNLRPMRPLADAEPLPLPHAPRRGSKELPRAPKPILDDSQGRQPLQEPAEAPPEPVEAVRQRGHGNAFPERLMGRRTTFTQLPDGEEKDWAWFMENVDKDLKAMRDE